MKNTKRLLIIVFAIQLIFPVVLCGLNVLRQADFEKNADEIKVKIDAIEYMYDDSVDVVLLGEGDYTSGDSFIFVEDTDGFYKMRYDYSGRGGHLFIKEVGNGMNRYGFEYKMNKNERSYAESLYNINVYSREIEQKLIEFKYIEGPATDAYMVLKLRNGVYEIKEIYIDGVSFEEFLERVENDEFDINRFDYSSYDYDPELLGELYDLSEYYG